MIIPATPFPSIPYVQHQEEDGFKHGKFGYLTWLIAIMARLVVLLLFDSERSWIFAWIVLVDLPIDAYGLLMVMDSCSSYRCTTSEYTINRWNIWLLKQFHQMEKQCNYVVQDMSVCDNTEKD